MSWTAPSSREGLSFPTLRLPPSLENPLENLSLVGVSAPSCSGCCSLCTARGVGLRPSPPALPGTSRRALQTWGPCVAAPGAPTATLRRSRAGPGAPGRAGEEGRLSPASAAASFLQPPLWLSEQQPGSPDGRRGRPQAPQKPRESPATPAPGLSAPSDRKYTGAGRRWQVTPVPRYLFYPRGGWVAMERGRLPEPQSHLAGPRPPLTSSGVWGAAQVGEASGGCMGKAQT